MQTDPQTGNMGELMLPQPQLGMQRKAGERSLPVIFGVNGVKNQGFDNSRHRVLEVRIPRETYSWGKPAVKLHSSKFYHWPG